MLAIKESGQYYNTDKYYTNMMKWDNNILKQIGIERQRERNYLRIWVIPSLGERTLARNLPN